MTALKLDYQRILEHERFGVCDTSHIEAYPNCSPYLTL